MMRALLAMVVLEGVALAAPPTSRPSVELGREATQLRADILAARTAAASAPAVVTPGTQDELRAAVDTAERALERDDPWTAAAALAAVVDAPRFADLAGTPAYQTAETDLVMTLARAGAWTEVLTHAERLMRRGSEGPAFAIAHRRAIDAAFETREWAAVLARLDAIPTKASDALSERAYLRGRVAYEKGDLDAAELEFARVAKDDRLYAPAVYLRGVIRVRQRRFSEASKDFCAIAGPDDDTRLGFLVDGRWFALKDLAQLGAARVAHEVGRYDDAYVHDFNVPADSERLSDAVFESAWSMFQKRELATARDLVRDFVKQFPNAGRTPEALLLGGYIELADCKLAAAKREFARVEAEVTPLLALITEAGKNEGSRAALSQRVRDLLHLDPALVQLAAHLPALRADAAAPGVPPELLAREARLEINVALALDVEIGGELEHLRVGLARVLEKARLGKVDAVLAEKRKLELEVEAIQKDRWAPAKLGTALEAGVVRDTDEYWPPEDEVWRDERKGWR